MEAEAKNKQVRTNRFIDISGKVFNKLTVVSFHAREENRYFWKCKCDCGSFTIVDRSNLKQGITRSCGCIARTQNGLSSTKSYKIWRAMMQRCYDTKASSYSRYGLIGVSVCDRWHIFSNFLQDMGERPLNKTLDRIDGHKGYSPANCRWVDNYTQQNNRKNNVVVEAFGIKQSVSQWARQVGMRAHTLRARIQEYGWSIEKALMKKVR